MGKIYETFEAMWVPKFLIKKRSVGHLDEKRGKNENFVTDRADGLLTDDPP